MAEKIQHFEAGAPGFVDQLNKLVDVVNKAVEDIDSKQDKRKTASSK